MSVPDALLALYLLIYVPARQLWPITRKNKTGAKKSRLQRYRKTIAEVAVLLLALAAVSFWSGHAPSAIGLDMPVSRTGQWGLLFSVVLLAALALAGFVHEKRIRPEKRAQLLAQLKEDQMLPRNATELRTFIVSCLMLGAGWEIIYRGFLMLVLVPLTGVVGAVALSATAYGAAHGYASPRQFILSIVSAFVFTIAFAATHSLWWLMLIHAGLPLLNGISLFKITSAPDFSVATVDGERQPLA